jgi:hypothetical protein
VAASSGEPPPGSRWKECHMPARLAQVTLANRSPFKVHWVTDHLDHGIWQSPWFPSRITNLQTGQSGTWRSESDGILTGTAGWALFKVDSSGFGEFLRVEWSRPYAGGFGFSANVSRKDPRDSSPSSFAEGGPPETQPIPVAVGPLDSDENILGQLVGGLIMTPVMALYTDAVVGHHCRLVIELRPVSVSSPLVPEVPPDARMTVHPFRWTAPLTSCSTSPAALTGFSGPSENWAMATASVDIDNDGGGQLIVQRVTRESPDPDSVFADDRIYVDPVGGGSYAVTVQTVYSAEYAGHPYPCELSIQTNGGSRNVDLGTIPDLDDAVSDALRAAALAAVAKCPVSVVDWGLHFHGLLLTWLIDPIPLLPVIFRLWAIEVGGLPVGSTFAVISAATETAMHATVGVDGIGRLAMLTDPSHGNTLEIIREDERPVEDPELLYIAMTQTEYVMSAVPSDASSIPDATGAIGFTYKLVAGRSVTV